MVALVLTGGLPAAPAHAALGWEATATESPTPTPTVEPSAANMPSPTATATPTATETPTPAVAVTGGGQANGGYRRHGPVLDGLVDVALTLPPAQTGWTVAISGDGVTHNGLAAPDGVIESSVTAIDLPRPAGCGVPATSHAPVGPIGAAPSTIATIGGWSGDTCAYAMSLMLRHIIAPYALPGIYYVSITITVGQEP